jgi:hypothetical protein
MDMQRLETPAAAWRDCFVTEAGFSVVSSHIALIFLPLL